MNTYRRTTTGMGYLGLIFGSVLCSDLVMASNTDVLESQIKVLPFRNATAIPSQIPAAKVTAVDIDSKYAELSKSLHKQLVKLRTNTASKHSVSKVSETKIHVQWADNGTPRQIRPEHQTPLLKGQTVAASRPTQANLASENQKTARQFLKSYQSLLKLDDATNELKLRQAQTDDLGQSHIRFQQYYQGIPLWGNEVIVHVDANGDVALMDGAFTATPHKIVTEPAITAPESIRYALKAVRDIPRGELTEATHLAIYTDDEAPARLVWQVTLSVGLEFRWLVMVDALTGESLLAYNQIRHAAVSGSGIDLHGTRQPLNLWEDNDTYFLIDTSKPMFKTGANPLQAISDSTADAGAIYILDAQNAPTVDETGEPVGVPLYHTVSDLPDHWDDDAVSAAFGLSEIYDYYRQRHNRDSLDGQGGSMTAAVRYGQDFRNAFWNGQLMVFGDAIPFAGALDIVAHELTHGVIQHSANLNRSTAQSSALNEAFADIFGEAVEAYSQGQADWESGASLAEQGRSFRDPGSVTSYLGEPYPASMSDYVNLPLIPGFDFGGEHTNSTIVSHAFYLLSDGLSGAIGIHHAERIFYRALTIHLTPRAQFFDARLACIQAASELFGADSVQVQKTIAAFDQVEIFERPATPQPSLFPAITAPDSILAIYKNPENGGYFLARRESALGDAEQGVGLSHFDVKPSQFSVDAAGEIVIFVDSIADVCLMATNSTQAETCLGFAGKIHSVAQSPSGRYVAAIFVDNKNIIAVMDLENPEAEAKIIQLRGFATEGASSTITEADAMVFSNDGRFLIYDALNNISLEGGEAMGAWSIYAIDTSTQGILSVIPPISGLHVGSPSLGHTSDDFLAFETFNPETNISTQFTANLFTGRLKSVGSTSGGGLGSPVYNGDDSAIIYAQSDQQTGLSTGTGYSLVRQALSSNHISPTGNATLWMRDAQFGFIYRRGDFQGPAIHPRRGLWWNPQRTGSGINIELAGNQLSLIWYTFNPDGSPTWYLASGVYAGHEWQAYLKAYHWNGEQANAHRVGQVSLDFSDSIHAQFSWELNGQSGSQAIEEFVFSDRFAVLDHSGLWYEAAKPGYGLTLVHQGLGGAAVLYFYDAAGNPRWALGSSDGLPRDDYPLKTYTGSCPACTYANPVSTSVGHLELALANGRVGSLFSRVNLQAPLKGRWDLNDVTIHNLVQ